MTQEQIQKAEELLSAKRETERIVNELQTYKNECEKEEFADVIVGYTLPSWKKNEEFEYRLFQQNYTTNSGIEVLDVLLNHFNNKIDNINKQLEEL